MSSCSSNSSNLLGNVNISDISNSGARLVMTHPLTGFSGGISDVIGGDGVTAGDVIRYDVIHDSPSENSYTKAQANVAQYAEMIGIIESIQGTSPNEVVTVILSGQIQFPADRFVIAENQPDGVSGGASGGNDVYFLSAATAGGIQNLAPYVPGEIAKPVLQIAEDGIFNAHVVNYIGYQIGGSVAGSFDDQPLTGTINTVMKFTNDVIADGKYGWFNISDENVWLALHASAPEYDGKLYTEACSTYFNDGAHGKRYVFKLDSAPPSRSVGRFFKQKDGNKTTFECKCVGIDRASMQMTVTSTKTGFDGKAVSPDLQKNLYDGTIAYTITNITPTAFALPKRTLPAPPSQVIDSVGKSYLYPNVDVMYVRANNQGKVFHVAEDVTMTNLTVHKKVTCDTADGEYRVTDLAKVVQQLAKDVGVLATRMGHTTEAYNVTSI